MRLVYKSTGEPVQVDDLVILSPQEVPARVVHFAPPHKPSSSGKVTIASHVAATQSEYSREVFVSVIGAEWVEREDREPKKVFNVHVRLADQYEAESEEQAFDKMMELLEDRSGFEIMGHDIIEETT